MYGVSPQPLQAPENSKSGSSSCTSLTESSRTEDRSTSGSFRKKSQFATSASRSGGRGRWVVDLGPYAGVRANVNAFAALDAQLLVPHRDLGGDVPLLPFRGADRKRAVAR